MKIVVNDSLEWPTDQYKVVLEFDESERQQLLEDLKWFEGKKESFLLQLRSTKGRKTTR